MTVSIDLGDYPRSTSLAKRIRGRVQNEVSRFNTRRRLQGCGAKSLISAPAFLHGGRHIEIGKRTTVMTGSRIEAFGMGESPVSLRIGDDCRIGPGVHLGAAISLAIGNNALFASNVYVTDHDHDWSDPRDPASVNRRLICDPVSIGEYAWLGERAMVLKGVSIGHHSIVGAASVVTSDIPPYSIAVGSPARVIRRWDPSTEEWHRVEPG